MKLSLVCLASVAMVLTVSLAHAEDYEGVVQFTSSRDRSEIKADAVRRAHGPNLYSDAWLSGVNVAQTFSRDRSAVQAEARARSHAHNQNIRTEAFANSRIPSYYQY
jgi:hypothetical protein